jgi:hypothetical protein
MMKSRILALTMGGLLLAGLAAAAISAGGTAYVKVSDADLREGNSLGGPKVAELPIGTPVSVIQLDRFRALVRTQSGTQGWISLRHIQEKPPASSSGGVFGGLIREDRSANELGTAASGRGLSEAAEQMAELEDIDPAVVESLRHMEVLAAGIKDAEVDAFIKAGGLNP